MAFLFWGMRFSRAESGKTQCLFALFTIHFSNSPFQKRMSSNTSKTIPKLYICGIHKNHKHIQPGGCFMVGLKNQHRLASPSVIPKRPSDGSAATGLFSTPQKSTCLYRAGAVGIAIVAMTAMTAMMIKREEKRYLDDGISWHFTIFEKFQTKHPTATWHGTETSENLLRSTVCFLQTSGRCVGLRA
jgi:hypothetical protein